MTCGFLCTSCTPAKQTDNYRQRIKRQLSYLEGPLDRSPLSTVYCPSWLLVTSERRRKLGRMGIVGTAKKLLHRLVGMRRHAIGLWVQKFCFFHLHLEKLAPDAALCFAPQFLLHPAAGFILGPSPRAIHPLASSQAAELRCHFVKQHFSVCLARRTGVISFQFRVNRMEEQDAGVAWEADVGG